MAQVIKCDICGAIFNHRESIKPADLAKFKANKLALQVVCMSSVRIRESYDMCECCSRKIEDYVKSLREQAKK